MASSDQQPPVANTNGLMPIVFSYSGSLFSSYDKFASAFSLVPGPAGYFGGSNYYGYSNKGSNANVLSAYQNFALSQALAPIKTAMNSNTSPYQQGLNAALSLWLSNDPSTQVKGIAAPLRQTKAGQTANIALDYLAQSARLYLYYGTGALPGLGVNEQPNFWTNPSWVEFFEPYIASNYVAASDSYTPSNGVDLTSIEQFAFPLSINIWGYDDTTKKLSLIDAYGKTVPYSQSTNQYAYPSLDGGVGAGDALWTGLKASVVNGKSNQPNRNAPLVSATQAGLSTLYYQDPATNDFPYHYFDDYLLYLSTLASAANNGFASPGVSDQLANQITISGDQRSYAFSVDFTGIQSQQLVFGDASAPSTYIAPDSVIRITGTSTDPDHASFTIEVPWAKGSLGYAIRQDPDGVAGNDALSKGWIQRPAAAPAGVLADIYSGDLQANQTASQGGAVNVSVQYSYGNLQPSQVMWSSTPASNPNLVTPDVTSGFTPNLVIGAGPFTITADANGNLETVVLSSSIPINGTYGLGSTARATDPNTLVSVTLTLNQAPSLDFVVINNNNGSQYTVLPTALTGQLKGNSNDQIAVDYALNAAAFGNIWIADSSWTTLSVPAGLYGANAGYTVNGTDVKNLANDLYGKVVGDVLAGLNTGFFGSTASWTTPGADPVVTTVGEAIGQTNAAGVSWWFNLGTDNTANPYVSGAWGPQAWPGAGQANYWNAWAYELFDQTPGQYNFAFTDRFVQGVFSGEFNPPPALPSPPPVPTPPPATQPVFAEIVVGDSPGLINAVASASAGATLYRYTDTITGNDVYRTKAFKGKKAERFVEAGRITGFSRPFESIDATVPVWHLRKKGLSFFTADRDQRNDLRRRGFNNKGVVLYTREESGILDSTPVIHFISQDAQQQSIWTADPAEVARLGLAGSGFINNGAAFFV